MNQPSPENQSQIQDNLVKDTNVSGDLNFAPVQIATKIETQIIQVSSEKVTKRELIKASPYKGLKRFNFGDREYFFGRDTFIARLFNAVNENPMSLVLGASGSGKSSVVRAGLIPEFRNFLYRDSKTFYDFIFTPNHDPFESLYRCLLNEEKDYSFSESQVEIARIAKPETLTQVISTLKKEEERWLLFIDQFEELFTICDDLDKRNNFIEGLIQLANSQDKLLRIVLAIRSDFLEQLSFYPALGEIANQNNIHLVTEMYPDELQKVIEQPAAKHGVVFEEGLVEQIIKDVEGQSGYLPLLQYTLNLLWESECITIGSDGNFNIENRILTKSSYAALEGVRGALQKRVNEIYQDICEKNKDGEVATKKIFLKLVNIVDSDSGSRAVSRRAYRDEFVGESVEKTLNRFIEEKLLVSSSEYSSPEDLLVNQSDHSKQFATVEIAHEILLLSWDILKIWLEQEKEAIILKNWLAGETKRWQKIYLKDESKAKEELLKGSRLEQITAYREENAFEKLGGLSQEENKFINASVDWRDYQIKEKEKQKQRELTLLQERIEVEKKANRELRQKAIIAILLAIVAGFAFIGATYAWKVASYREKTARSLQLATASDASLEVDSTRGLLLAIEANLGQETPQSNAALWNAFQENYERLHLLGHTEEILYAEFSPNNTEQLLTVSKDATARIWNLNKPRNSLVFKGHEKPINYGTFDPNDPRKFLTVSDDGTARVWNINNSSPFLILKGHQGPINYGTFVPDDSNSILTAGSDGTIRIWKTDDPDPKKTLVLKGHQGKVFKASFAPQNPNLVLTVGDDSIAKVWDLEQPEKPLTLKGHEGSVLYGSFDPKNPKRVLTVSSDRAARIWDLDNPTESSVLEGHTDTIVYGSFSPHNSQQVLTVSEDGRAYIWNLNEPDNPQVIGSHQGGTIYAQFNPVNPTQVLTVGRDGTAKIWNISNSQLLLTLKGHQGAVNIGLFIPKNPNKILTVGEDATVRIWDTSHTASIELPAHPSGIEHSIFNPENPREIFTLARNGTVKIWDVDQIKKVKTFVFSRYTNYKYQGQNRTGHYIPENSRFNKNNPRQISTITSDGTALIWNLENPNNPIQIPNNKGKIWKLNFDPQNSNRIVTMTTSNQVTVWDLKNLNQSISLPTFYSRVVHAEFDPNNSERLATANVDGKVYIWNLKKPIQEPWEINASSQRVWHISFDPKNSNRFLTMGSDSVAYVWDLKQQTSIALTGHRGAVVYGSFDPNNPNRLLTVSHDETARIWDLRSRDNPLILKGHVGKVLYGSFAPNNSNQVLTVGADGKTRIYTIGGKGLLRIAWNNSSRCFTPQEITSYNLDMLAPIRLLSNYLGQSTQSLVQSKSYCSVRVTR